MIAGNRSGYGSSGRPGPLWMAFAAPRGGGPYHIDQRLRVAVAGRSGFKPRDRPVRSTATNSLLTAIVLRVYL